MISLKIELMNFKIITLRLRIGYWYYSHEDSE